MALDPIRLMDPPVATQAAPAQAAGVRPHSAKVPGQSSPSAAKPVAVAPAQRRDEINIKWAGDDGVIVMFTDKKSGEVFRQIPSEQVLSVVRFIREMLAQQSSEGESQQS